MNIAVLFDGAGLARFGLEQAGHKTTGFELNPIKALLSNMLCKGECHQINAYDVNLNEFDAVWASPPCQHHSRLGKMNGPSNKVENYADKDALAWSLNIDSRVLWVENVIPDKGAESARWGLPFNAAQFTSRPLQNRPRLVGGKFLPPKVYRNYQYRYDGICPTVVATEWKGCKSGCKTDNCCKTRAARFYKRRLTLDECAYHQGFTIPHYWLDVPYGFTRVQWERTLYEAIGNGVPVYMARAFGEVYQGE